MTNSAFNAWFSAQHGPRQFSDLGDGDLFDLVSRGQTAQVELDARRRWDEKMTSALYAWNISDADKANYKTNPSK